MKAILTLIILIVTIGISNMTFSQNCVPIDNRNVGGGGTHAIICFFDGAGVNMGCLDCQLAGASGWKCGAGFNAMAGFHVATISGVPCFNPAALPVELLSYELTSSVDKLSLNWVTNAERNNSHFIVERSTDGSFWEKIGQIQGSGNSTELNSYAFDDNSPYNGISYYRLTQVDYDGVSTKLFLLDAKYESAEILVYPIPVNKSMFIEGKDIVHANVQIVNSIGEKVQVEQNVMGDLLSFNFTEIKNGVYLLIIENDFIKETKRVVVFHK